MHSLEVFPGQLGRWTYFTMLLLSLTWLVIFIAAGEPTVCSHCLIKYEWVAWSSGPASGIALGHHRFFDSCSDVDSFWRRWIKASLLIQVCIEGGQQLFHLLFMTVHFALNSIQHRCKLGGLQGCRM